MPTPTPTVSPLLLRAIGIGIAVGTGAVPPSLGRCRTCTFLSVSDCLAALRNEPSSLSSSPTLADREAAFNDSSSCIFCQRVTYHAWFIVRLSEGSQLVFLHVCRRVTSDQMFFVLFRRPFKDVSKKHAKVCRAVHPPASCFEQRSPSLGTVGTAGTRSSYRGRLPVQPEKNAPADVSSYRTYPKHRYCCILSQKRNTGRPRQGKTETHRAKDNHTYIQPDL